MKAIDVWVGMCMIMVFGALLEFTLVNWLANRKVAPDCQSVFRIPKVVSVQVPSLKANLICDHTMKYLDSFFSMNVDQYNMFVHITATSFLATSLTAVYRLGY